MIILNSLIEVILQLILFSLIPFVYYVLRKKKVKGFLAYLGFVRPPKGWIKKSMLLFLIGMILAVAPLIYISANGIINSDILATNKFNNKTFGLGLLFEILVYAVLKTSLSEELFFRGFLAKRLISRFGFLVGNTIQAVLFGLIHGIVFIQSGIMVVIIISIFPAVLGYLLSWINEQKLEGSIIPSWSIHAAGNIVGPILIFFWS